MVGWLAGLRRGCEAGLPFDGCGSLTVWHSKVDPRQYRGRRQPAPCAAVLVGLTFGIPPCREGVVSAPGLLDSREALIKHSRPPC